MNGTLLTIAIVIIIMGLFWLIRQIEEKSPIIKDRRFVQIRKMLREGLLPLGFVEKQTHTLVSIANYQRNGFLVELYFDDREKEYSFFASHDVQDSFAPPRQVSITFPAAQYNSKKVKTISNALDDWLKTIQ